MPSLLKLTNLDTSRWENLGTDWVTVVICSVCESVCPCTYTLLCVCRSESVARAEGLWASVVGMSRLWKLRRPRGQLLVTATGDWSSFLTMVRPESVLESEAEKEGEWTLPSFVNKVSFLLLAVSEWLRLAYFNAPQRGWWDHIKAWCKW